MQYKNMQDQLEEFVAILEKNKELMTILDYITELHLPHFYIAAGAVFQTIWNYYDQKELNFGIKDIDVIYYDADDLSVEKDLAYYNKIQEYVHSLGLSYEIDVSNEARMHLWKMEHEKREIEPYQSCEEAMSKWIVTVHAVGITKEGGEIKVYAPYGLSDIFSRTIRPIRHEGNSREIYEKKVASWKKRFSNLHIVEW